MFTVTSGERAAVRGAKLEQYAKLEIQDPDLNWVDVSTSLDDPDWFNSAVVADQIDRNTLEFSASLLRDSGSLSLCPLREDSTLNRDGDDNYAQMLDMVRMWRLSVSVVTEGGTPSWKEIAKGYIDSIDPHDDQPTIDISGRGEEAPILDCEILEIRTYSAGSTATMAEVIQALLDDNLEDPPTLYDPDSIAFVINEYEQDFGNLMNAIQNVAALVGATVRYRYDSAGVNRLTLFIPNRDAVPGDEDWTIGPEEYLKIPLNRLDISGVRNYVSVRYNDSGSSTVETVYSPATGMSPSIAKYKRRSLPIDLGEDSQILASSDAQALADAVRSDLEYPVLQQQIVTYGFWFVQLCDYGRLLANGVHYNEDKYGGVTAYQHEVANGVIKTSIALGAVPASSYKKWIQVARLRRLRPTGGPIGDPMLPTFEPSPPPAPGSLVAAFTGNATVIVETDSDLGLSSFSFENVFDPPVCVPYLSGLAVDSEYAMGLCDVSDISDVAALSSQFTGSSSKDYSAEAVGKRMSHVWGASLTDDVTSANGVRHITLGNPGSGVSDLGITWPTDTYQNIRALFPGDTYPDFWARAIVKNMAEGTNYGGANSDGIFMGAQAAYYHGLGVWRKSSDHKLYLLSTLRNTSDEQPTVAITSSAVLDSDLVDIAWHYVLTNPTNGILSRYMQYDVTVDIYITINGGTAVTRQVTGQLWQTRFGNNSANALAPLQLALPDSHPTNGSLEIHGWEFVDGDVHADPFNLIP